MVVYQGSEGVRMEYPEKSCAAKQSNLKRHKALYAKLFELIYLHEHKKN